MTGLLQPFDVLAHAAARAASSAVWRGELIGAAVLVAVSGAGFLLFAAFLGLRMLLGPGLAALVMGLMLLLLAAGLFLYARSSAGKVRPNGLADDPQEQSPATPARPAEAATLAVFTAAFLLGRSLTDRNDPPRKS